MTFAKWFEVDGHFDCDDDSQKMMAMACEFNGFDLPAFDIWASALPDCGLKVEMEERRQMALEALSSNQHDAAKRHLEWMLLRSQMDRREQFLLPLAKHADGVRRRRSEILTHAREHRTSKHDWDRVKQIEEELGAKGVSQRGWSSIIERRLAIPAPTYRAWRRKNKTIT